MQVLVTGATGFIGRPLLEALLARGHEVRALARSRARAANLPHEVDVRLGDLAQPATLAGLTEGVEVVIHLAGVTRRRAWAEHQRVTVEGTRVLLEQARASGVRRFVHVSTVLVYDLGAVRDGTTLDETSPVASPERALGAYARGKVEAELAARQARGQGLDVVIVRPGLVYGPGRWMFEHLGHRVGPVRIAFGSGRQRLPLVSLASVVDALQRLATEPRASGRTYVLVDPDPPTRRQYLRTLGQLTQQRHPCVYLPVTPVALACAVVGRLRRLPPLQWLPATSADKIRQRARSVCYDSGAPQRDTGWRPATPSFREGLQQALQPDADPDRTASAPLTRRPIRVGIIGAGHNARHHLAALRAIDDVTVTGLLDTRGDVARALAQSMNLPYAGDDPEVFYRRAQPDVVHIVTPPQTHAELALEALRHGARVLCEKPMAMTEAQCRQIEQAARERGLQCGVNHNLLYDPRFRQAQRLLQLGTLGELVHIDTCCCFDRRRLRHASAADGDHPQWICDLPGGVLEDLLPHPLYLTLQLLGPSARVTGHRLLRTGRLDDQDDELRLTLIRGDTTRTTAHLMLSLAAMPDGLWVRLYGTRATAVIDLQNMCLEVQRLGPGPRAVARGTMIGRAAFSRLAQLTANTLRLVLRRQRAPGDMLPLLRDFYDALRRGQPVPIDASHGRAPVTIIRTLWPPSTSHPSPADATGTSSTSR